MRSGISLVVLFTTGEAILERCLSSARMAVDEIVAVDTGATDGARSVAEKYGATIYDLVWPDAFDAAYNFALAKVQTEWTLLLDSDEWLLPESIFLIQKAMNLPAVFAYNLIRQDVMDEAGRFTEMFMLRMWRTHPAMRMQGVIHSQFTERGLKLAAQGRALVDSSIRFAHDGFKSGLNDLSKTRRNLPYLERELEKRPGQLYFEICLAESYWRLGDPRGKEMAEQIVSQVLSDPEPGNLTRHVIMILGQYLDSLEESAIKSEKTQLAIDFIDEHFPNNVPGLWAIQRVYLRAKRPDASLAYLRRIEELARTGEYDRHNAFAPALLHEALWFGIAQCSEALGDKSAALDYYQRVLQVIPAEPTALERVRALQAELP